MRPSTAGIDWIMLAPLGASIFAALLFISTKSLTEESDFKLGFYPSFIAGVLCIPLMFYFGFKMPTLNHLIYYIISGIGINIGIILVSKAYAGAPSATIAPFHYSQILWGVCFGYFVFNDLPDLMTWIGTGIIIISGLYLIFFEHKLSLIHI